ALRVIARRHRDHAAPPLIRRQRGETVQRAAFLEGGRELQIFEFEPDPAAKHGAERPALVAFGLDRGTADGRGGSLDVGQRHASGYVRGWAWLVRHLDSLNDIPPRRPSR